MWAEIIIPAEDLSRLLAQALPLTIHLGDPGSEHSLGLSDLREVRLVPDVGLRVECKARVHWPVLGIEVPVVLNSLSLLLLPAIGRGPYGDVLSFRISIEHADIAGVPSSLDRRISDVINTKLGEKGAQLSWDFSRTLSQRAPLPALLDPLESFALRPAWAKIRITSEAIVYAASFHSAIVRRGELAPAEFDSIAPLASSPPEQFTRHHARPGPATRLAAVGIFGIGAGVAYYALREAFRGDYG